MSSNEGRQHESSPDSSRGSSYAPPEGSGNEVEGIYVDGRGLNVIKPATVYHKRHRFRVPETIKAVDEFVVQQANVVVQMLRVMNKTDKLPGICVKLSTC